MPAPDSNDKVLSHYFLPYQLAWIRDESRLRLAEKSVRIGWTYADAMKNTRKRLFEIYEQAYDCNPAGSTSCIVPWTQIELCRQDCQIPRVHLEALQFTQAFGPFQPGEELWRERRIADFITASFAQLIHTPAHYRLGFDVAASGQGDLACIYLDRKEARASNSPASLHAAPMTGISSSPSFGPCTGPCRPFSRPATKPASAAKSAGKPPKTSPASSRPSISPPKNTTWDSN